MAMGAPAMAEYQSQTILIIQQTKKGSSTVYDKNENPTSNDFVFPETYEFPVLWSHTVKHIGKIRGLLLKKRIK